MKRLIVEENNCISCGACVQLDSEHFNFSDKGTSTVISNENLYSTALATAIDSCPVSIIHVVESDTVEEIGNKQEDIHECGGTCEGCHCEDKAA